MLTLHRSLLMIVALLILAVAIPAWPVAAGSRYVSVTTTLNHGVTCTTTTILVNLGSWPANSSSQHQVKCNVAVGRIHVNAAQSNETTGTYYGRNNTCYNTDTCSTYIELKPYVEGTWLLDTAGIVGTTANPSYYGFTNNANVWSWCYNNMCDY